MKIPNNLKERKINLNMLFVMNHIDEESEAISKRIHLSESGVNKLKREIKIRGLRPLEELRIIDYFEVMKRFNKIECCKNGEKLLWSLCERGEVPATRFEIANGKIKIHVVAKELFPERLITLISKDARFWAVDLVCGEKKWAIKKLA